jgi:hypothetical protein
LKKFELRSEHSNMNLIVEKTRKNDVSNTNGVLAAAHESVHGPQPTCQSR